MSPMAILDTLDFEPTILGSTLAFAGIVASQRLQTACAAWHDVVPSLLKIAKTFLAKKDAIDCIADGCVTTLWANIDSDWNETRGPAQETLLGALDGEPSSAGLPIASAAGVEHFAGQTAGCTKQAAIRRVDASSVG